MRHENAAGRAVGGCRFGEGRRDRAEKAKRDRGKAGASEERTRRACLWLATSIAKADSKDASPQEPAKSLPKILDEQTWAWEPTSAYNYAKYGDLAFEVGMGDEKNGVGIAEVGLEIENLRSLSVTVDASPVFKRHDDNSFAGFVVDYHTRDGYTKRVSLPMGFYSQKKWSDNPRWGKRGKADQFVDFGKKNEYELDLQKWAPDGWDGRVWFMVSLQNSGRNTKLKGTLSLLDNLKLANGKQEKQGLKEEAAEKEEKPTTINERARFTPLDLSGAATIASTRIFNKESLSFPKWGKQTYHDVPFLVIDPDSGKTKNGICLYSPQGTVSAKMPQSVRLRCDLPAKVIHVLGAAGWGVPWFKAENTLSMVMRVEYANGSTEDHEVINGVHLTDWANGPDVPGSKGIGVKQVRYFSIVPKRQDAVIRTIEFRKGTDKTSPLVMGVTVEAPVAEIAKKPKDEPAKNKESAKLGSTTKVEKPSINKNERFQHLGSLPERPDSQGEIVVSPNGKLLASGGMGNEILQFGRELFGRELDQKELHRIYVPTLDSCGIFS